MTKKSTGRQSPAKKIDVPYSAPEERISISDDGSDGMYLLKKLGLQKSKSRSGSLTNSMCEEEKRNFLSGFPGAAVDGSIDIHGISGYSTPSSMFLPDWYEDLTDDHTKAFKELFDALDSSKTGTLNADTLYNYLMQVDSDITKEEVEEVLKKLDKDGNGEIDFDEFLFHMTNSVDDDGTGTEAEKKKKEKYTRRQKLFYSAITHFSLKHTLRSIEKSMRQQPHVLSHYTAGVRLIGLTDRQLEQQMKKMQKDAKHHNSPYAKPLPFVSQSGSIKSIRPGRVGNRVSKYKLATERTNIQARKAESKSRRKQSPGNQTLTDSPCHLKKNGKAPLPGQHNEPLATDMPNSDVDMANIGLWHARMSVVAKLPGYHLIAKMRSKLMKTHLQGNLESLSETASNNDGEHFKHRMEALKTTSRPLVIQEGQDSKDMQEAEGSQKCIWRAPKIPMITSNQVPLPVLKIKYIKHRPTIDDLPNIREKATQAMKDYYHAMRKATVHNAFEHWEKLYADTIRPKKLLENFRIVYRAYSPHKEEEAFVVCPWIPGPQRHHRQPRMRTPSTFGYKLGRRSEMENTPRPFSH